MIANTQPILNYASNGNSAKHLLHAGLCKCEHCGEVFDKNSNAQKYCSREDNAECQDDRYYQKLWNSGKHPLQKTCV